LSGLKGCKCIGSLLIGHGAPDTDGWDSVVPGQVLSRTLGCEHTAREQDGLSHHLLGGDHAGAVQVGFLVQFRGELRLVEVAADNVDLAQIQ